MVQQRSDVSTTGSDTRVTEFVRALAMAWKGLASYPPGHPALVGALDLVQQRLDDLRGPAGDIVFGIASDGLVYGEEKIASTSASKFARALYDRGVALICFETATTTADVASFLGLLRGVAAGQRREPIWEELTQAGVTSIRLQPVDYSEVSVTDSLADPSSQSARPGSLWDEILRALVAGRQLDAEAGSVLSRGVRSADELNELILKHMEPSPGTEEPLDLKATFGGAVPVPDTEQMRQAVAKRVADVIGLHLAGSSGGRGGQAVQQVLQLLRSLPESMRASIVRFAVTTLATNPGAALQLRELSSNLGRAEVIEALNLVSPGRLSPHALSLLESLTQIERPQSATSQGQPAVLTELLDLFAEEDLDRFNPSDHEALLAHVSVRIPLQAGPAKTIDALGDRVENVTDDALDQQLILTLLDLLALYGGNEQPETVFSRLEALFSSQVSAGNCRTALDCIQRLRQIEGATDSAALREAIDASLGRMAGADSIRALIEGVVAAPAGITADIQKLTEALGGAATRGLLLALTEEQNRSRRRRLFDFVVSLGPRIVPEVSVFLRDARWYVVRNMIILLRTVNDRSSIPAIRECAHHSDLRVRLEAIKTLLAFDPTLPRELLSNAINDPDPKLAEAAVVLVGSYGIKEAVDPLLQILAPRDLLGTRRQLRIRVINVLAELAEPSALERMQGFFRDSILPWPSREERRAAYESLAGYPVEVRAPLIEKGLRARDRQVREICRRLESNQDRSKQ
jgi:HEAT repeat protein